MSCINLQLVLTCDNKNYVHPQLTECHPKKASGCGAGLLSVLLGYIIFYLSMRHLLASKDLGNHLFLSFIKESLMASKAFKVLVIIIGLIIRFLVKMFASCQPPSLFL